MRPSGEGGRKVGSKAGLLGALVREMRRGNEEKDTLICRDAARAPLVGGVGAGTGSPSTGLDAAVRVIPATMRHRSPRTKSHKSDSSRREARTAVGIAGARGRGALDGTSSETRLRVIHGREVHVLPPKHSNRQTERPEQPHEGPHGAAREKGTGRGDPQSTQSFQRLQPVQ